MKKKIIVLLITLFGFMLIPLNTNAAKVEKANIYMFRGEGCPHCQDFLKFLNNLDDEYKKMFELTSYEVWYDSNNAELMSNIASFLNVEATGVPFIIIGEKTFVGYGESYDSEIKDAIKKLYETDVKKRYDVLEEFKKSGKSVSNTLNSLDLKDTLSKEGIEYKAPGKTTKSVSSTKVIIWNLVFTVVSTSIILFFINYKFNKLNKNIKLSLEKTKKVEKK